MGEFASGGARVFENKIKMRKIHFHLFVCSLAKILIVGGRSRGRPSTGGLLMVSPGSDEWSANKAELSGCPQNKCYSVKEKQCQLNEECYDLNCHGAAVAFKFKSDFLLQRPDQILRNGTDPEKVFSVQTDDGWVNQCKNATFESLQNEEFDFKFTTLSD